MKTSAHTFDAHSHSRCSRFSSRLVVGLSAFVALGAVVGCGGSDGSATEGEDSSASSDVSGGDTGAVDTRPADVGGSDVEAGTDTADGALVDAADGGSDTGDAATVDTADANVDAADGAIVDAADTAALDSADASLDAADAADAADACSGVSCSSPPGKTCAGATAVRTYSATGTCESGTCSYAFVDTACVSPPSPTCADAHTRRTYASTGTCALGSCSYAPSDTACPSSQACTSGTCALCPLLTVACPSGCCAVPAVDVAPVGRFPSVAIDAAGYIYVGFTIQRSTVWGEGLAIWDPTAATWSTKDVGSGGYASKVLVSSTGRVHHFFGGSSTPYVYRYSDDHGATWTTRTVSSSSAIGGTGDLAIGAGDVPHIVYQDSTSSVWPALIYAVGTAGGASWTKTVLDAATTSDDHPSITLAFADRPHVFTSAYKPGGVDGSAIRHVWYDGAAWNAENVDTGKTYATGSEYYLTVRGEAFADDSLRVVYTRTNVGKREVVRADRSPGATGTWSLLALSGTSAAISNPIYVDGVSGAPALVADGITAYRPDASFVFAAPTPAFAGTAPGVAVSGKTVFVAYQSTAAASTNHLFFSRIDY